MSSHCCPNDSGVEGAVKTLLNFAAALLLITGVGLLILLAGWLVWKTVKWLVEGWML